MPDLKDTKEYWQPKAGRWKNSVKTAIFDEKEVHLWQKLILDHAPAREHLRILDIGCGPGFFAIILAMKGHKVTAIDCTEGMLEGAAENARTAGVPVECLLMNAEEPEFPENTFDLIVTRNVTWTLPDPVKAYRNWRRILRPGGRMLVFDGNWYMNFFDQELEREFHEGMRAYRKEFGEFPGGFSMYRIEDYWLELPLVGVQRPDWDRAALWKLGYTRIQARDDLGDIIYAEDQGGRLLYGTSRMFLVCADKPTDEEHADMMRKAEVPLSVILEGVE